MSSKAQNIELLILACSAGGMMLLMDLLNQLDVEVGFSVIVVIHRNDKFQSSLEQMAQYRCKLKVKQAEEKELLARGVVYFAPAGYHLLIENDKTLSLDISEPVNYCRPSIDVTMQSAAEVYGERLAAILLSGANKDGAEGMRAVYKYGGLTLAQSPTSAEVDVMPKAAIDTNAVRFILTDDQLRQYCRKLV